MCGCLIAKIALERGYVADNLQIFLHGIGCFLVVVMSLLWNIMLHRIRYSREIRDPNQKTYAYLSWRRLIHFCMVCMNFIHQTYLLWSMDTNETKKMG